jgi:hypothetical protein
MPERRPVLGGSMNISFDGIVDVGISLAVIYLMLSLLCTTLNEIAATVFSLRAKSLSVAVRKILEDDGALLARFYDNGLIRGSIASSQNSSSERAGIPKPADHSSYLDSRTFAMALLGSLEPGRSIALADDIKRLIDAVPGDGTSPLPTGLKDVLNGALVTANGSIHSIRDHIAEWFDASMDRLSGSYKRQLRWLSFVVGFGVAVLLNVDSIAVGQAVWNDKDLRQQLVASSTQIQSAAPDCAVPQVDPATPPTADLHCQLQRLADQVEDLRPLPIGWSFGPAAPMEGGAAVSSICTITAGGLVVKLFGWLLTAFALSLGAPFWFDVLSKIMNVRGAGAKPKPVDEKPTEA